MAVEERSPIPVEWVDAEEWDAIEQALAAATSHLTPRAEGTNSACENATTRPRRTLPAWSQKKKATEDVIPLKIDPEVRIEPVVAQTNLSRLTDSWAQARFMCKEKVRSRSQYLQFKGRIVYSTTFAEVDAAAHEIWNTITSKRPGKDVAVGFDLEWKTSFQRGGGAGKVAVVQLCLDSTRCDVLQIIHSGVPPSLATLLEDSSIIKTGVGSRGDASKLRSDYGIQTRGVVDLAELANQKLGRRWQSWSLSSLAEELTCKKVEKVSSIRCGDWEGCPLSSPQLQYAATDAFASLYLYQILETFPNHMSKNEESSSESVQTTAEL